LHLHFTPLGAEMQVLFCFFDFLCSKLIGEGLAPPENKARAQKIAAEAVGTMSLPQWGRVLQDLCE